MRKVFVSVIIAVLCLSGCAYGNVEADPEIHRVIGGLYSLACAVELNCSSEPQISQLRQYFSDVPNDWYSTVQVSRVNNAVWAGVSVGKTSTARQFLRKHSQELGICESPDQPQHFRMRTLQSTKSSMTQKFSAYIYLLQLLITQQ